MNTLTGKNCILAVLLILLAGCNQDQQSPNSGSGDGIPVPDFGEGFEGLGVGSTNTWPDYIPDDIPALEGEISMVMEATGSHIRIFYENVSDRQIEAYLEELEEAGFQLEYILYVQEGFPDTSDDRAQRGEYDAVDITRGEYHMRLEVGGGLATYDIYTSGFELQAAEAQAPQWPGELAGLVPPPSRCALSRVVSFQAGNYQITCSMEDEAVFDDYRSVLGGMGFEASSNIVTAPGVGVEYLENGETTIQLRISFSSEMEIVIETQ